VFKIGSNIKGDLTQLQKQFPQLSSHTIFNVIDLKQVCADQGLITWKYAGSLAFLCKKILHAYLAKPELIRQHEQWELKTLTNDLLHYACLDIFASWLIFEKASQASPLKWPSFNSPPGTWVAVLIQENGDPIAYGKIAENQPTSFGTIQIKMVHQITFFLILMMSKTQLRVKLRIWMEMSGLKSCEALASTCRLRRSLDGCLEFRRSGQSRRVRSWAEKKLKVDESELREVGC